MTSAHREFMTLISGVAEEDYLIPESFGRWTLANVVAHIIGWLRFGSERLRTIKSGNDIVGIPSEEVDAINDQFVREINFSTKAAYLSAFEEAHSEILGLASTLTEEEISRKAEGGVAASHWLPNFTDAHLREHAAKIRAWLDSREEELDNATGAESKIVMANRVLPWLQRPQKSVDATAKAEEVEALQEEIADYPIAVRVTHPAAGVAKLERTSTVPHDNAVPTPPFWGSRVETKIKLEKVWEYLNEVALFRGQWQMKRGKRTPEEFEKTVVEVARPKLQELKLRAKREGILDPKVAYGYYPCWSEGDDLVVLRPKNLSEEGLQAEWKSKSTLSDLVEWKRFSFPRQPTARRLCLADFYLPKEEAMRRNMPDVVAFTAVTVGRTASDYTAKLFASDQYADYLFLHGLSVETAEALAEYWHKVVRSELGIADKDAKEITRLFSQGYQGSRYSFGYPACPALEDQTKLFEILHPERIDVSLTEEYHLVPEQSTTAIITHHPSAKYFSIK
jgi:cobalamin-dependent methionine synthase I